MIAPLKEWSFRLNSGKLSHTCLSYFQISSWQIWILQRILHRAFKILGKFISVREKSLKYTNFRKRLSYSEWVFQQASKNRWPCVRWKCQPHSCQPKNKERDQGQTNFSQPWSLKSKHIWNTLFPILKTIKMKIKANLLLPTTRLKLFLVADLYTHE